MFHQLRVKVVNNTFKHVNLHLVVGIANTYEFAWHFLDLAGENAVQSVLIHVQCV